VLLLAFDTATPAVTVALHDGAGVVAEETGVGSRKHGELLAASIESVLRSAGTDRAAVTAIAVGTGPGPYTGLRAGLVTARVLASSLAIRLDGICTLDVIADAAAAEAGHGEFLVATDARRRELYWARYSPSGERICGPHVGQSGKLPAVLPVAGEGGLICPELADRSIEPRYPSAVTLAGIAARRLQEGQPPQPAEPLYLRKPDAREPGPVKRVTP
jgi:tRNA threonylcarbamoyl adenosine modification protein YeaZ